MRWLVSILFLLAFIGASPVASAHPGHVHATQTQLAAADAAATTAEVTAVAQDPSGAPCDCPNGHCACGTDCLSHCAPASAVLDPVVPAIFPARPSFATNRTASIAEWSPRTDDDPPRPNA